MSSENISSSKSRYDQLLDKLCDLCTLATGVSMVTLTVIFGWLVYGRYILNSTPTWVEQVSLLLIMCIGFLGAAVGVHQHTHLGVTFFRDISPTPIRRSFELISYVTMLVFGWLMAINSYELVLFKWGNEIPLIGIPEGVRAIPITICCGLIFLFSIGHLIHFFTDAKNASSTVEK